MTFFQENKQNKESFGRLYGWYVLLNVVILLVMVTVGYLAVKNGWLSF